MLQLFIHPVHRQLSGYCFPSPRGCGISSRLAGIHSTTPLYLGGASFGSTLVCSALNTGGDIFRFDFRLPFRSDAFALACFILLRSLDPRSSGYGYRLRFRAHSTERHSRPGILITGAFIPAWRRRADDDTRRTLHRRPGSFRGLGRDFVRIRWRKGYQQARHSHGCNTGMRWIHRTGFQ